MKLLFGCNFNSGTIFSAHDHVAKSEDEKLSMMLLNKPRTHMVKTTL
jgi:hypothetical protein